MSSRALQLDIERVTRRFYLSGAARALCAALADPARWAKPNGAHPHAGFAALTLAFENRLRHVSGLHVSGSSLW